MPPASPTTLIEAVQTTVRRLHYSPRTEEAYLHWIRVFIAFHEGRHPRTLGGPEITAFLNHLAVERHTAASTQNQALCAVLFLYRRVLNFPMPELNGLERARRPEHLPDLRNAAPDQGAAARKRTLLTVYRTRLGSAPRDVAAALDDDLDEARFGKYVELFASKSADEIAVALVPSKG
jgi:hypothetical protein